MVRVPRCALPRRPLGLARAAWLVYLVVLSAWPGMAAELSPAGATPPGLRVPEGFTVELVAAPPLVAHPLMAGFDERGRLYVAESAGLNLDAGELLEQLPNSVRRLEDVDGDGRFDRQTLFADKMTFPMGALWYRGGLYVASPPHIWRLEDRDDDGVAEHREPIVGKFNFIGNAADIHGCFLATNGRIYWCDGRHGHHFVDAQGQVTSQGKAARLFSCRPDGSDVQAHCGGGMDNPVEVDFTEQGEMLGTVNLFYQARGDCLVHWMWGGAYPRYDQAPYVAEFKRTGDLLPPVIDFGHVAVSGVTRYRGAHLGPEFTDRWFYCEFNTHQVAQVVLRREGSTFQADRQPFLVSSNVDFHPTDVLEDADGSLLVIDTGGWFRNGCPTSQVAKPEVLGAIYRIRRADASRVADPRGLELPWSDASPEKLVARLSDPRPAVRQRALDQLAQIGDAALPATARQLEADGPATARLGALWALCRLGTPAARQVIRRRLADQDPDLRLAAVHAVNSLLDADAAEHLTRLVASDQAPIRREAATALGRLKHRAAVPALLASLESASDRLLEHALIYALIEIADPRATEGGLTHVSSLVRRGALIALDQMEGQHLTREQVVTLLDTDDLALQQATLEIISRHPDWAHSILGLLGTWLTAPTLDEPHQAMLRGAILAFHNDPAVQERVAAGLAQSTTPDATRRLLLETLARVPLAELPAAWHEPLRALLANASLETQIAAVRAVAGGHAHHFLPELSGLAAGGDAQRAPLRLAAIEALARAHQPLDESSLSALRGRLAADVAPFDRLAAAQSLAAAALTLPQVKEVAADIATAGPLELATLLSVFREQDDLDLGTRVVTALARAPGLTSLTPQQLEASFLKFPQAVQEGAQSLAADRARQADVPAELLDRLSAQAASADVEHGRAVFQSTRAACQACHRIAGQGGQIGPDLSRIGAIRTPRDLVEAVVLPSQSLARGYESYSIATRAGTVHTGVIGRQTLDAVWLRTTDRAEVRIPHAEIEDIAANSQSVMPAGFHQVLSAAELTSLVAFLSSLK